MVRYDLVVIFHMLIPAKLFYIGMYRQIQINFKPTNWNTHDQTA